MNRKRPARPPRPPIEALLQLQFVNALRAVLDLEPLYCRRRSCTVLLRFAPRRIYSSSDSLDWNGCRQIPPRSDRDAADER
jgi:hypothetical protein